MPWKATTRRCLHIGPKVKLPSGHPLPEPAEDMAIKIQEHSPDERGDVAKERNSLEMSDLAASLPVLSRGSESDKFCFDRYISDLDVDQESDDCHSLFNDSGTSTLGQSASSFMSWMDEAELEKSKEVQRLVDEIDDAIYDSVPFPVTDQKALEVLHQIKDSRLHLRVIGKHLENVPPSIPSLDEESFVEQDVIEVFASHGVYEENNEVLPVSSVVLPKEDRVDVFQVNPDPYAECGVDELPLHYENEGPFDDMKCGVERTRAESNDRFLEKVKSYVMDQLVCYVLSESVKTRQVVRDKNVSSLSEDEEQDNRQSTLRPNTREDDDSDSDDYNGDRDIFGKPSCVQQLALPLKESSTSSAKFASFLHVSPMTIHPLPRKSLSHVRYSTPNYNFDVPLCLNRPPPNRNAVKDVITRSNFGAPSQFSVISLSKPINMLPRCVEAEKGVKMRGYHSAAVVKKSGMLDRRFSITAGHERFLEPLVESRSASKHRQQASAPSSPAKWLRRHTLPPINDDGLAPISKVSLLPLNVPVLGTGLTRLQLAKQLLEQADHRVLWSASNALDNNAENIKDFRKAKEERKPRRGNRH